MIAPAQAMTRSHHQVTLRNIMMTPSGFESRVPTLIFTQNVVTIFSIWT